MKVALLTISLTCAITALCSADVFWIALSNKDGAAHVMKINALGNILQSPTRIISAKQIGQSFFYGIGIQDRGDGDLLLWLPVESEDPNDDGAIYRAIVSKRPVGLLSIKKTRLVNTTSNLGARGFIQVTHKQKNNFLTFQIETRDGQFLSGFDLTPNGLWDGTSWLLSSRPVGLDFCLSACGGGTASDGRAAFLVDGRERRVNKLFIQQLGPRGRPTSDSQLIAKIKDGGMTADITGLLPDGRRFLIYALATDLPSSALFLQILDARTGQKIGDRILLREFDTVGTPKPLQSIAADPRGHFVIFVNEKNELLFQALDATGHASGGLKVLARDVGTGIDIVKGIQFSN